MRVVVGGGTGFVGRALTQLLRSRGHEVTHISRQGGKDRISWEELSHSGLPLCDAVVNLAGENVLNPFCRWNDAFCREVISSRVETTKTLAKAIADAEQPPHAWVLVTGVGYYRPSPTAEYTEDSPGGDFDFFSRLVSSWEAAALTPGSPARGVVVRSGIVCHALESEHLQGILNGVAPSSPYTSNGTFAQELAAALGRPALLPVPAWAVRAVFGAERAVMLLEGQRVVPKHTLESGYHFIFPDLSGALKDIVA
ncbi:epimerase family protein SDR39U1-like isoform X4 [Numenius arquata]|uniref:epimerase family protein SDR39U1-like isoform X4 n=1 Tax=Numenius arquata TaxID=31919 RepID=UPI003D30465C